MPGFLQKIIEQLLSKKKIIAWVSAALIAIVAGQAAMDPAEVKAAICDSK